LINKKYILPVLLLALIAAIFLPASAVASDRAPGDVTIYFFWGDGCPHCAEEEIFLDALVKEYPQVKILDYEVWYDTANQEILKKAAEVMGFEPKGVPVTIIGDKVWIGFREQYKAEITDAVIDCIANTCESPIDKEVLGTDTPVEAPTNSDQVITVPFFGDIDLGQQSLAISTLIIGFVDGFNPCSLWVISVLLAMTLTSGSRTKVITVGLTFLIVTTLVYVHTGCVHALFLHRVSEVDPGHRRAGGCWFWADQYEGLLLVQGRRFLYNLRQAQAKTLQEHA
jgi:thiol-disulfide isomerase/thioredoxin